ncbi:MAG: methanogen output domain 1-containing protein [Candidatus Methanogasteraceae archaeon]
MTEETKPKILVVDDESMNVDLLEAHLYRDYDVVTASSGEEVIEKVKTETPALILLDIMMPGMDGYEVSKRLKSNPDTQFIPIILVTALSEVSDRIKGSDAGSDEFLTKPVNKEELMSRVKSLLRTKSLHDDLLTERDTLDVQNRIRSVLTAMIPALLQPLPPEQKNILIHQMTEMVEVIIVDIYPFDARELDRTSTGEICANVMNQLGGSFAVDETGDTDACIIKGTVCPWGAGEARRNPILCNLTRGIFARIAARAPENQKVKVQTTIGNGDDACIFRIM